MMSSPTPPTPTDASNSQTSAEPAEAVQGEESTRSAEREHPRLLIGASGSSAVSMLPAYLLSLVALPYAITLLLTRTAESMMPARTLASFGPVYTDAEQGPGHVRLGQTADVFLLLPCSAHLLSALASGAAPNLVATTALAHPQELLIVPAMNETMWQRPAVQRNVERLEEDGHILLRPVRGRTFAMALGEYVDGLSIPPPDRIAHTVRDLMTERLP